MNALKKAAQMVNHRKAEEGHARAWGGGGIVTIILVVLLLILIF